MTILLYEYSELEERAEKSLKVWKACHTILYIAAAVFGILSFTFLQSAKDLVDDKCIFYPRQLEFHWVDYSYSISDDQDSDDVLRTRVMNNDDAQYNATASDVSEVDPAAVNAQSERPVGVAGKANITKREIPANPDHEFVTQDNVTAVEEDDAIVVYENTTHRLALDTSRTLFAADSECDFAEYMPLLSTVFALVWATMFIMCPGGGRSRTSIQQPWRILLPALIFALVMVGLTGFSFNQTNGGLHAFCAAFQNYTNATTCSSVDPFLQSTWSARWGAGPRAAAARASAAAVWATWAVATAIFLARCLAAPDFVVRKTRVYLKDPQQKYSGYLKKSPQRSQRSPNTSPLKKDTVSVISEPTITSELVMASVERNPESPPPSPSVPSLPWKSEREGEHIEMTYTPQVNSEKAQNSK